MGASMLRSARRPELAVENDRPARGAFSMGFLLSATNPYFYFWWLSVGIALVLEARSFGTTGFTLFMLVHWLCDLAWLWLLSALSFKGGELFGTRFQLTTFVVCGLALAGFGVKFVVDAVRVMTG
jgi:threonine/homoserine/homoserine lactone efflux protein